MFRIIRHETKGPTFPPDRQGAEGTRSGPQREFAAEPTAETPEPSSAWDACKHAWYPDDHYSDLITILTNATQPDLLVEGEATRTHNRRRDVVLS